MTWAEHLISFYRQLEPPGALPNDITWLHPQHQPGVMPVVETFYTKYFNDNKERSLIMGINPGRFGAGITGVNFTAPRQLLQYCGIPHPFRDLSELSAEFVYDLVTAYGGPEQFYARYFIGSVCPLGFVQHGKNLNYYDDKELLETVRPFIIRNMERLLSFGVNRELCICMGGEKNFRHLSALNEQHGWFKKLEAVPHPRFIMQYRRKHKEQFIHQYLQLMTKA